jgi:hypothetical protein
VVGYGRFVCEADALFGRSDDRWVAVASGVSYRVRARGEFCGEAEPGYAQVFSMAKAQQR